MSEAKQERDPRVDPVAGDVLSRKYQGQYFESRGYSEREVDEVEDGYVVYVGPDVCSPRIKLASWRKWAAIATVINRGDE